MALRGAKGTASPRGKGKGGLHASMTEHGEPVGKVALTDVTLEPGRVRCAQRDLSVARVERVGCRPHVTPSLSRIPGCSSSLQSEERCRPGLGSGQGPGFQTSFSPGSSLPTCPSWSWGFHRSALGHSVPASTCLVLIMLGPQGEDRQV